MQAAVIACALQWQDGRAATININVHITGHHQSLMLLRLHLAIILFINTLC